METRPAISKRHTIGKYLRHKKGIHKKDPKGTIVSPPKALQEYIDYLKSHGAIINKLDYAQFQLKNGLPYTGLIATDKIVTDEIVVRIPRHLILSTKIAFFSEVRPVFLDHPKFFSPYFTSTWEDHMLLVYLLYEYSKGEKSNWYHLLNNLPRDIDYVVFWEEEELKDLEDTTIQRLARRRKKQYDQDEAFVIETIKKYPGLLDPDVFTPRNIRWIYTHLITRCFGKYFEYVVMVPFAELFNHECSDVYYDLEYFSINPDIPKDYAMDDPKEVPEEQIEEFDTSDGTYDSDDFEFDSDYEYDKDDVPNKAISGYQELEKDHADKSLFPGEISSKLKEIEASLTNDFDWSDGFSIFFAKEIYKEALNAANNYSSHKITINSARNFLKSLETSILTFKKQTREFYRDVYNIDEKDVVIKQKENILKMAAEDEQTKEEEIKLPFEADSKWKDDKFDNFVMKASWKDQFEKGSQVFFCYGRLSNRLMLLRYGVALEYNKYDHVHFKVPFIRNTKDVPWILEQVKRFRLSRYMRFKLKRTSVNISLINFCKGLSFSMKKYSSEALVGQGNIDFEIKGIEKACELLEDFVDSFSKTPEEYKDLLSNPATGYHKYFAIVYCLEKQRLVTFQVRGLKVLQEILLRIRAGAAVNEACAIVPDLETEDEYNRNRIFLGQYISRLEAHLQGK